LVGCILEVIGYAARCFNPNLLVPYIIQSVFILIAPAYYAATTYMLFGKIAHLLFAEKLLILPAKYNTLIMVLGDIFSLLLQASGGGLMANQSSANLGSHIVIGGLFVQIAFFGLFISNEFLFLMKIHKVPCEFVKPTKNAVVLINLLLLGSILIFIRSIVRTAEFIEGYDGVIMTHEWFLYVFDATPMFLTSLIYTLSM
ncbi:RTA-like protein, partial [Zygosaccharomyces rouxii]